MAIEIKKLAEKWHVDIKNEVLEMDFKELKGVLEQLLNLKEKYGNLIKVNNLQPGQMQGYNNQFR